MKSITKVLGVLWTGLDGFRKFLHLLLLLLIFLLILVAISPRVPIVPGSTALVVAPQGALVEQLSGDPLQRALAEVYGQGSAETLVRDVINAIEAGREDTRVKALVLDLGGMAGGGISKLEEIAKAVREFKAKGKKVIALGEGYDQAQYYLAANADEIYLDPQGLLLIQGFGYYRMFLKGVIDKLSVDINIFRAGKFKSFTDQYSRSDMSEQEREESSAWLNALWGQYQAAVTKARGIDAGAISAYVNELPSATREQGGDLAKVALARGLITEIKSRHDVEERLKQLVGVDEEQHTYQGISHWDYLSAVRSPDTSQQGKRIAVVVASGEILDGDQPPGTIGSDSAVALLRKARFDTDIKAVVLRIDSPGGSMLASEVIRREIGALRAAGKPVVASMSSTAASGGYYIAMDADEIWASPSTLTGSIGVFAVIPTFERTLNKIGVTIDGIGTTPLAGALSIERSFKPEVREILQYSVDNAYQTFIGYVAAAREKTVDEIDAVAQGRVWAGSDSVAIGLVDKLGSFREALDSAAKRGSLGEDYKVEYIEPSLGWRQALARQGQVLAARLTRALLPEGDMLGTLGQARKLISPVEQELGRLARFGESLQPYYYCACSVH